MKKTFFTITSYFFVFFIAFSVLLGQPQPAAAVGCTSVGQCVNNKVCECKANCDNPAIAVIAPSNRDCGSAIIGGITPPDSVKALNDKAQGATGAIGIVLFLSRLLDFASIIAGMLIMFNVMTAGFTYITSAGDTAVYQKVKEKILWSGIGIIVIVSSYALAGIAGQLFFGDAGFILNPKLQGAL